MYGYFFQIFQTNGQNKLAKYGERNGERTLNVVRFLSSKFKLNLGLQATKFKPHLASTLPIHFPPYESLHYESNAVKCIFKLS